MHTSNTTSNIIIIMIVIKIIILSISIKIISIIIISIIISIIIIQNAKVYSTRYSQAVTHPSTNRARRCLTSVIGREPVFST